VKLATSDRGRWACEPSHDEFDFLKFHIGGELGR